MNTYALPLHSRLNVHLAIRVPFSPESMERQYQHTTIALHQHHYSGKVEIDSHTYNLKPGDVTLTPPQVVSRYELADAGHHWCIHFDIAPIAPASVPSESFHIPLHLPTSAGSALIGEQIQNIHDITRYRAKNNEERQLIETAAATKLSALLMGIALRDISTRSAPPRRKSDNALTVAREELERNFQKPITVAELVRASGLSPHYFAERFQHRYGVTVNAYLLNLRLEMARHLLLATNLPIKEVAFECGIPDPQYFNKQFRRAAGVNPSEYRSRGSGNKQ